MTRRAPGAVLSAILLGCWLLACGPVPTSIGRDVREVTVGGEPLTVLVAGEDGMRDRDDFGGADGMLFDLGSEVQPTAVAFVMDGVRLPLAIAWFSADGRLVGTDAMVPCPAEPCPRHLAPAPFRWAIEAPVGAFDALPPTADLVIAP